MMNPKGPKCCSAQSLVAVQNFVERLKPVLAPCRGCYNNLVRLFCRMACDENQADFVEVIPQKCDDSFTLPFYKNNGKIESNKKSRCTALDNSTPLVAGHIRISVSSDYLRLFHSTCFTAKALGGNIPYTTLLGPGCNANAKTALNCMGYPRPPYGAAFFMEFLERKFGLFDATEERFSKLDTVCAVRPPFPVID